MGNGRKGNRKGEDTMKVGSWDSRLKNLEE